MAEERNQRFEPPAPGKRRMGSQGGARCFFVPACRVRHCTACGKIAPSFNVHRVYIKVFTGPWGVMSCHINQSVDPSAF